MKRRIPVLMSLILAAVVMSLSIGLNLALFFAHPNPDPKAVDNAAMAPVVKKTGDEELAYLLVKLELQTRKQIAGHFTRPQSPLPGVNKLYQRFLVKNLILPAAVADRVFSETVPSATGGRAWVKMVVDNPRNPNNVGDAVAAALLSELRRGAPSAARKTADAVYYSEPIKATRTCLFCHGEPQGDPDPYFPEFTKDGWREGDIIGAVVARVAPRRPG